jgi:hypothetical protein
MVTMCTVGDGDGNRVGSGVVGEAVDECGPITNTWSWAVGDGVGDDVGSNVVGYPLGDSVGE